MDPNRFDRWTRNLARRLSRRDALRLAGASGASAALAARAMPALAQTTSCSFQIHSETVAGPSAPSSFDGVLSFTIGDDDTFTQASFTPNGGQALPASGRATGRAIDFQITFGDNRLLSFFGTAAQPLTGCTGEVAGTFDGPQPGDLGGWQATTGANAAAPASKPQSTTSQPTDSNCQSPSFACGPNCCPGGGICTDASQGICACPDGAVQCGLSCVPGCPDGQTLDLDSCACVETCGPNQSPCKTNADCCSSFCDPPTGTCADCTGVVCGDAGCVDITSDRKNCSGCGILCNGLCSGGECACIPDGGSCEVPAQCCTGLCPRGRGLCGCSQIGEHCAGVDDCCQPANGALIACLGGTDSDICIGFNGVPCLANTDCLSQNCVNGTCQ